VLSHWKFYKCQRRSKKNHFWMIFRIPWCFSGITGGASVAGKGGK
jgi:hypothetical protein